MAQFTNEKVLFKLSSVSLKVAAGAR